MVDYYPWNVQALATWLKSEIAAGKKRPELAEALQIPEHILKQWLLASSSAAWSSITSKQLQSIARYRNMKLVEIVRWLDICPAHLENLKKQAKH
ncbi:MAG: hypothetical protein AAGE59_13630 [Cyanobacteria bacterium P01_F01_bin.86]